VNKNDSKIQITGNGLKLIAIVTMLVDHFAYGIYYNMAVQNGWYITIFGIELYRFMRLVGRIAFPIYCFLLVEGYFKTRDKRKYAFRLLTLAIISEYPFDKALNYHSSFWDYNNVIFTLFVGLLVIWAIDEIRWGRVSFISDYRLRNIAPVIPFALGCGLTWLTHTDYKAVGIATIVVMYYLHGEERIYRLVAFAAGVVILILGCSTREATAFVALIPLYYYNGKRGSNSLLLRHFFNSFYPVHLAVIAIAKYLLF